MTEELSPGLKALGDAIARSPDKVRVARCGFDLWLEVMTSGHVKTMDFKSGGVPASAEDVAEKMTLTIPIMVIGRGIVVNFDPTVPGDQFILGA